MSIMGTVRDVTNRVRRQAQRPVREENPGMMFLGGSPNFDFTGRSGAQLPRRDVFAGGSAREINAGPSRPDFSRGPTPDVGFDRPVAPPPRRDAFAARPPEDTRYFAQPAIPREPSVARAREQFRRLAAVQQRQMQEFQDYARANPNDPNVRRNYQGLLAEQANIRNRFNQQYGAQAKGRVPEDTTNPGFGQNPGGGQYQDPAPWEFDDQFGDQFGGNRFGDGDYHDLPIGPPGVTPDPYDSPVYPPYSDYPGDPNGPGQVPGLYDEEWQEDHLPPDGSVGQDESPFPEDDIVDGENIPTTGGPGDGGVPGDEVDYDPVWQGEGNFDQPQQPVMPDMGPAPSLGPVDIGRTSMGPVDLSGGGWDRANLDLSQFEPTTREVQDEELVSHQLQQLLESDSPYMQNALQRGAEMANDRGALSSSIFAGAAQRAAIEAALPIASADAKAYITAASENMAALNQNTLAKMSAATNMVIANTQASASLAGTRIGARAQLAAAQLAANSREAIAQAQLNTQREIATAEFAQQRDLAHLSHAQRLEFERTINEPRFQQQLAFNRINARAQLNAAVLQAGAEGIASMNGLDIDDAAYNRGVEFWQSFMNSGMGLLDAYDPENWDDIDFSQLDR